MTLIEFVAINLGRLDNQMSIEILYNPGQEFPSNPVYLLKQIPSHHEFWHATSQLKLQLVVPTNHVTLDIRDINFD